MGTLKTIVKFALAIVVGVVFAPLAVLVCVSRWTFNTIGDAWDDIDK